MSLSLRPLLHSFFYGLIAAFVALVISALFAPFLSHSLTPESVQLSLIGIILLVVIEEATKGIFLWRLFQNIRNVLDQNIFPVGLTFGLGFITTEVGLSALYQWNVAIFGIVPIHILSILAWAFAIFLIQKNKQISAILLGLFAIGIHIIYNVIVFIHT